MVVAIPVILAGAVFVGLQLWGGDGDPETLPQADRLTSPGEAAIPVDLCGGPQPAPTEPPPEVSDWTQVVQSLYGRRAEAFNEVNAEALCDVYAPTSQVLADDAELLQMYADSGVHTQGLAFEVVTAELITQEEGRVFCRSPTGCRPMSSSTPRVPCRRKRMVCRKRRGKRNWFRAGRLWLAVRLRRRFVVISARPR